MKEMVFQGNIKLNYMGDFKRLILEQDDGYLVDLILRLQECTMNYGEIVQVSYYISPKKCSLEQAQTGFLNKLYGNLEVNYEREDYQYSEYTSGTDYNSIFDISGHNLFDELSQYDGKYLILNINFFKDKKELEKFRSQVNA